jgi:hypothetical protein
MKVNPPAILYYQRSQGRRIEGLSLHDAISSNELWGSGTAGAF